jgi:hypothetical protein
MFALKADFRESYGDKLSYDKAFHVLLYYCFSHQSLRLSTDNLGSSVSLDLVEIRKNKGSDAWDQAISFKLWQYRLEF